MIILSWLLWALRDHFCRLEDAKLAAPDRFRNFKMNWEVSALACFALFADCLIKKNISHQFYLVLNIYFKKKLCVIADNELLSKFMCGAVSEYFGWKISSHPAEMLCSSAPRLMSTRKKFYITVQVYPVGVECLKLKTRKQNLKMVRLLNIEILKSVLLIWKLKQINLMLRSPNKTNLDAQSKAYWMLAVVHA